MSTVQRTSDIEWNGPVAMERLTEESRLAICKWFEESGIDPSTVTDIGHLHLKYGALQIAGITVLLSGAAPTITYKEDTE